MAKHLTVKEIAKIKPVLGRLAKPERHEEQGFKERRSPRPWK
jgi:hypothetical protein